MAAKEGGRADIMDEVNIVFGKRINRWNRGREKKRRSTQAGLREFATKKKNTNPTSKQPPSTPKNKSPKQERRTVKATRSALIRPGQINEKNI